MRMRPATAGYSTHLLFKHIRADQVARALRTIYRLVHFPAGEHEELVTAWLWSEQGALSRTISPWSCTDSAMLFRARSQAVGCSGPRLKRGYWE
jgi:hypothetical protein